MDIKEIEAREAHCSAKIEAFNSTRNALRQMMAKHMSPFERGDIIQHEGHKGLAKVGSVRWYSRKKVSIAVYYIDGDGVEAKNMLPVNDIREWNIHGK